MLPPMRQSGYCYHSGSYAFTDTGLCLLSFWSSYQPPGCPCYVAYRNGRYISGIFNRAWSIEATGDTVDYTGSGIFYHDIFPDNVSGRATPPLVSNSAPVFTDKIHGRPVTWNIDGLERQSWSGFCGCRRVVFARVSRNLYTGAPAALINWTGKVESY